MPSSGESPSKGWFHGPLAVGVVTTVIAGIFAIVAAIIARPTPRQPPVKTELSNDTAKPIGAAEDSRTEHTLTLESVIATLDSTPQLRQRDVVRALFIGRRMETIGAVDDVWETSGDENNGRKAGFVVKIMPKGYGPRYIAYFDTTWREPLSALRKGDTVRVAGTMTGIWIYMQEVYTKSSELLPR